MKIYDKVFWALFSSSLLLTLSGVSFMIFFPILLNEIGFDYLTIGILVASTRVGSAIFQLFVGAISDRQENPSRKRSLVLSILLQSFSFLPIFFLTDLASFILISLSLGILSQATQTILNTIVTKITSKEKIGGRMGLFRASVSIGVAAGGTVLGAVANSSGVRYTFLSAFLLSLPCLFVILFTPFKELKDAEQSTYPASSPKTPDRLKFKSLSFVSVLLSFTLISMVTWADNSFLPLFIVQNGLSLGLAGVIMGLGALVEAPVFILIGKLCDIANERKIIVAGSLSFVLIYVLTSQAHTFPEFGIIQIIRGFSFGLFNASCLAFVGKFSPAQTGKAFGFYFLCLNLAGVLGPLVSSFVSNLTGLSNMFLFQSLISGTSFIFAVLSLARASDG